jgi:hypothetical protein
MQKQCERAVYQEFLQKDIPSVRCTRKCFLFRHIDLTSAATHHFANFLLTTNGGMRAESTAKYAETRTLSNSTA